MRTRAKQPFRESNPDLCQLVSSEQKKITPPQTVLLCGGQCPTRATVTLSSQDSSSLNWMCSPEQHMGK